MRRHSKDPHGVDYKAYEALHLRISKSLTEDFSTAEAATVSREDWKADSVLTSTKALHGEKRSAIDDVKQRFRAASYKLGSADWVNLFRQYDHDGCTSLALAPLPLIFAYRSEESLCGTATGSWTRTSSRSPCASTSRRSSSRTRS